MGKKEDLLEKLYAHPIPRNFKVKDLDKLMNECGCEKFSGGRGSALRYIHINSKRTLIFDGPHPGNDLYVDHVRRVRKFLNEIGEGK